MHCIRRYKQKKNTWSDAKPCQAGLKKVRLQRDAFIALRDQLKPQLKQQGRNHLTTGEQLFTALFFFAHGSTYPAMAEACLVSESTICRCVDRVATALSVQPAGRLHQVARWRCGSAAGAHAAA